jgi:hypothetical protein
MTKRESEEREGERGAARCLWCRRSLPDPARTGRPRRYCKQSCRQQDYEARRRSSELSLGDDELVIARSQIDELRDAADVLAYAVDDTDRDLTANKNPTRAELRELLDWLLDAARPLHRLSRR